MMFEYYSQFCGSNNISYSVNSSLKKRNKIWCYVMEEFCWHCFNWKSTKVMYVCMYVCICMCFSKTIISPFSSVSKQFWKLNSFVFSSYSSSFISTHWLVGRTFHLLLCCKTSHCIVFVFVYFIFVQRFLMESKR